MAKTRALVVRRALSGEPRLDDFGVEEREPSLEPPKEGGVVVRLLVVSADPYMRGTLRSAKPGDVVRGYVAGKVVASTMPAWKPGQLFGASLPFVETQVVAAKDVEASFRDLSGVLRGEDEISLGIGILGMPGSTAYAGIELMTLQPTDKAVWGSAATGAVGALVGQILKRVHKIPCVIGSAGGPAKCQTATSKLGFDACFDYKEAAPKGKQGLVDALKKVAPNGIDVFFDNVGGDHLLAASDCLNTRGRIVACGAISNYNKESEADRMLALPAMQVIYKQLEIRGLLCGDWLMGRRGNFLSDMNKWYRDGLVSAPETFFDGLDKWPHAFVALFQQGGDKMGKVVVRVA